MKSSIACAAVLALSLSACAERSADPVAAQGADPGASVLDADPAAPPPMETPAGPQAEGVGTNVPRVVADVITFEGFGPAAFGSDPEQVRIAWGNDLGDARPSEPGGCYYLTPHPIGTAGYSIAFMIEGERFVRVDVRNAGYAAPGGGRVGMPRAEVEQLYAGRVEALAHKYVDGAHYLRVADSDTALVFETDTAGQVTEWRVGTPPQVDYVEGCS
ncbi:hypothetical protein [Luteimonas deserti]|uniref:Lectin n=1 Tax=Luteimonas deserti TaxID=2752306 RepID=A0A7Z0QR34_9GAMM|nr:hypothetical protein [Luteimonas deserti]NYZ62205.1 hypothetical protein [Luteimonas deserti]